ncbi:MAG TPA: hypothetical protein VFY23_03160 [Candidatus Limnocylindrales bacterium]|nr:hypothetical protein [Candidatus Limnocylindrales bacterium]
MSPSEIAFLAVGLILGAAIGAAIVEAMRARPAPRRRVRVTISPNTVVPRRSMTLSGEGLPGAAIPVPGSPEDGALHAGLPDPDAPARRPADAVPGGPPPIRTPVPSRPVTVPASAVGVPVGGEPATTATPDGRAVASSTTGVGVLEPLVTVEERAVDLRSSVTVGTIEHEVRVRPRRPTAPLRPTLAATAVGIPVVATGERSDATASPGQAPAPGTPGAQAGPCEPARRLVDERCALASAARNHARGAADALREAQRAYDTLREHVDRAERVADPRDVASAKDELHRRFRAASDAAATPDEAEAAAREWLDAINERNARAREASRFLEGAREELRAAVPRIDRLSLEADAARIAAESADAGCRDARERLAACEEDVAYAAHTTVAPGVPEEPHPFDALWPGETEATRTGPRMGTAAPGALALEGMPAIIRVLRGDREARDRLAATIAGDDAGAVPTWQLRLSALLDAISARAIEDGYLDLPDDDPFWSLFEAGERRDVVAALSALGYRFDGLGGFADGRVPAARDLALAVGYAGLDRMRIRTWPRESEAGMLLEHATVAADEWLVAMADDLSLGQMVDALGPRAADLADTWNAWGRVRPALLAID